MLTVPGSGASGAQPRRTARASEVSVTSVWARWARHQCQAASGDREREMGSPALLPRCGGRGGCWLLIVVAVVL